MDGDTTAYQQIDITAESARLLLPTMGLGLGEVRRALDAAPLEEDGEVVLAHAIVRTRRVKYALEDAFSEIRESPFFQALYAKVAG